MTTTLTTNPTTNTADILAIARDFRAAHGHRLRIATKYHRLVRAFLSAHEVADYQLVESERDGLPKVDLLVSPRLGSIDEDAVLTTALRFIDDTPGVQTERADRWRQGSTLSVVRSQPIATSASKVMALHVVKGKQERPAAEPRVARRGR